MNYYSEIKTKLLNNEIYEKVKDYSKERHRVLTYFEIGRLLHEAGKHYGESIIKKYSERLSKELNSKYNERTLERMRQFYVVFSNSKWFPIESQIFLATNFNRENTLNKGDITIYDHKSSSLATILNNNQKSTQFATNSSLATLFESENTLNKGYFTNKEQKTSTLATLLNNNSKTSPAATNLSLATDLNSKNAINKDSLNIVEVETHPLATILTWSHYIELLAIKDINEIQYYVNICVQQRLTRNALRKKIKSKEYQRLPIKTRNKLIAKENLSIKDYVPNPILIKNTSNTDVINEKLLHSLIMEDISSFMKELGEGYSFIDSEYKIKIDDRYNYIDFLLYNYRFKCFVVIELKVTELKSEYVGQILKYMHYVDFNIKTIEDDKTIGIIICKRNNQFYLEYCSDSRVISREYKLV